MKLAEPNFNPNLYRKPKPNPTVTYERFPQLWRSSPSVVSAMLDAEYAAFNSRMHQFYGGNHRHRK